MGDVASIIEQSSKASRSLNWLHPYRNRITCSSGESELAYIDLNNRTAAVCWDSVMAVSECKFSRFSDGCADVAGCLYKLTVPLLKKYIASDSSPWRIRVWAGENFFFIAVCDKYIRRSFSTPLKKSKLLKNLFLSFMPPTVKMADDC